MTIKYTFLSFAVMAALTWSNCCIGDSKRYEADSDEIPDNEYVTVKNGHLHCKGRRVRFWGIIYSGKQLKGVWQQLPAETEEQKRAKAEKMRKDLTAAAQRTVELGFNMYRCWHRPSVNEWRRGDCSSDDVLGYFLNELDKRGVRVWMSAINDSTAVPEDVNIVYDPGTAMTWQAAIRALIAESNANPRWNSPAKGTLSLNRLLPKIWDARLEAVHIAHIRRMTDFRNHYKGGLRLGDDPQIAIWEISNEERWLPKMFRGEWMKLPQFFQEELLLKWQAYLTNKYKDEEALKRRWLGLLPGESLKDKTILLAPLLSEVQAVTLNDANPEAIAVLQNAVKQKYTRDDFNRHRGEDVIEFLLGLLIEHKTRVKESLKSFGKSCRLAPCLLDTGEGYNTQYTYLHQYGDAVPICTYVSGLQHDHTDKRFPWNSLLDEQPRLCWNVPWIETQRIANKPFVAYETNTDNPSKYRAEFPYLFVSLASIQDFDAACWHLFSNRVADSDEPEPYNKAMDYSGSHTSHPQGFHYRNDEVLCSAIRTAGEIFKTMSLSPAAEPTTFVFGRRTVYDPASMDYGVAYGKYGDAILPTTYRYGTRMYCDVSQEQDSVNGQIVTNRGIYEACPIRPSEHIEYDWRRSYLKFDAAGAIAYVGFFAEHNGPVRFKNGAALDKVTVNNPRGTAYPVTDDELFIAFSAVSRDGLPLEKTKDAEISLVSTSFNAGFKLNHDKIHSEYLWSRNSGATVSVGNSPVLVVRTGAELTIPQFDEMKYVMKDWHMRDIGQGKVENSKLVIANDKPIFVIELKR